MTRSPLLRRAVLLVLAACWFPPVPADDEIEPFAKLGPHRVGVRTVTFVDRSRPDDPYTPGGRTLLTEIWYPAEDGAQGGDVTFSGFFGTQQDAARRVTERFGSPLEEVDARFHSIARRDVPAAKGRFPVLVFSHGNGGIRQQNAFQLDHLASHGYVILSPDHTGNAAVTPLDPPVPYDRKGRQRSAVDRPLDVTFLLDEILAANGREDHWLAGRLDAERIGVLGHSFGGFTACRAAESDSRVRAILPMTVAYGKSTDRPLLLMLAKRDQTMGEGGNVIARMYWTACGGPKHLLEFGRAGHFTFSDMDAIRPDFGDGVGRDRRTGEEFLDTAEAKRLICAYGLAFFEHYLRGSMAGAALLRVTPRSGELEVRASDAEGPR